MEHKFIDELREGLQRDMEASMAYNGSRVAEFTKYTDAGEITVRVDRFDDVWCGVWHEKTDEQVESAVIAKAVRAELPTWNDVEEEYIREMSESEWERNGFRNASDYYEYKYG